MNVKNDYSFLFKSKDNKTHSIDLSEYASIKSGSYKKALNAYYKKQEKENIEVENKQNIIKVKDSVTKLKESIENLSKESLWKKKTDIVTKDDKLIEDYDWNKITDNVQMFVESYNKLLENTSATDNRRVLRNSVWLVSNVRANDDILKDIGITVGSDNKLTLEEEKLKKSNMYTLENLFIGYNSLLSNITRRVNNIDKVLTSNTYMYDSSGNYRK